MQEMKPLPLANQVKATFTIHAPAAESAYLQYLRESV